MKTAERITIVLLLIALVGGGAWIYFSVQQKHQDKVDAVARGEYQIPKDTKEPEISEENWQAIYPGTVPVVLDGVTVQASVADSLPERIKGLSGTPFLPENVVKLFVFGAEGEHAIWMKDMNYDLDIIWVDRAGQIVHIEEQVSADSYPQSFSSPVPAWYVVEAVAGFVEKNSISLGGELLLGSN